MGTIKLAVTGVNTLGPVVGIVKAKVGIGRGITNVVKRNFLDIKREKNLLKRI
jgi:hypothetical protein